MACALVLKKDFKMIARLQRLESVWAGRPPAFLKRQAMGKVVYNPSFLRVEEGWVEVWREAAHWKDDAEAMLMRPSDEEPVALRTLSTFARYRGRIADPKLWQRGDGIWVTFNTGWVRGGNAIYVAQVWPGLTEPLEVRWTEQKKLEKNWGFFENAAGELRSLYGVASGTSVLEPGADGAAWREVFRAPAVPGLAGRSLGSQPVAWKGRWYVTVHRKLKFNGRRAYLGQLWSFAEVAPDEYGDWMRESPHWIHSFRALRGYRENRNRNLFSCVYLSGLAPDGTGGFWVGYGLNDRGAHLAHYRPVT